MKNICAKITGILLAKLHTLGITTGNMSIAPPYTVEIIYNEHEEPSIFARYIWFSFYKIIAYSKLLATTEFGISQFENTVKKRQGFLEYFPNFPLLFSKLAFYFIKKKKKKTKLKK